MFTEKMSKTLAVLLIVFSLFIASCGAAVEEAPAVEEAAPLAQAEEAAPAEEAPAEEAPVEEVVEEFDVVAAVDEYMSVIPEGYMIVRDVEAVKQAVENGAVLIDVRETSEYAEGHILNGVNVPIRTIAQNLDKIPADQPVLVYCKSGYRAALATSALRILGYDNVRAYSPGSDGWIAAEETLNTEAPAEMTYDVPDIAPELVEAVDSYLSSIPDGYMAMRDFDDFNQAVENGAFVIDVRETTEYAEGFIPGAINIPLRTVAANIDQVPQDQPVLIYCKSGFRAALATSAYRAMGYDNVRPFAPGMDGWIAAELPVEMP